jgi:diguanylate cyclase (GGDEF)-like protein/PAS domain S-box-containing protein
MTNKHRRSGPVQRSAPAGAPDRYTELCGRYPGPAAFIDMTGRVLDMNDEAAPLLAMLDSLPGGLRGLATAIGTFPRFDVMETTTGQAKRFEVALVPLTTGVLFLARDRALSDNLNAALVESRKRYKDLVDISSDFAWEVDAEGRFVFVSPRGALGYTVRDLIGRAASAILPLADAEPGDAAAMASPFVARGRLDDARFWLRRADGEPALVTIAAQPLLDSEGRWCGARGVVRDVTPANEREIELAENETRDRLLAHVLRALVDAEDTDAGLAAALRSCVHALGAAGGALWRRSAAGMSVAASTGTPVPDGMSTRPIEDHDFGADAVPRSEDDGMVLRRATAFRHRVNGMIALWRDPAEPRWSERDAQIFGRLATQFGLSLAQLDGQQELERQARTDPLTGLLNRRAFLEEIRVRLGVVQRTARPAALVYIDVDNFKPVNDVHGHAVGDAVLRRIAERIRRSVRASDVVARLGGDEFAIWLDEADAEGARMKGRELVQIQTGLTEFSGLPDRPLGFSIGIAIVDPRKTDGVDELVERADRQMYLAKFSGKGRVSVEEGREQP